jgi:hypothetical protein
MLAMMWSTPATVLRPLSTAVLCLVLLMSTGCQTAPPVPVFVPAPIPSTPTSTTPTPAASPLAVERSPVVAPPGINAGIAVFDRQTGTFIEQLNATRRFRSASLVKLLIALDYLWSRGPDYALSEADRGRFELMLRGSDDNAATYFWQRSGGEQVVQRMITRLSLQNTAPPSAVGLKGWGSTTLSAADIVRIYQYILDTSPAAVRDIVMGNLRRSTPCGTDRFHQAFGIPSAVDGPWAAKQGWFGFGDVPANPCTAQSSVLAVPVTGPVIRGAAPTGVMNGEVLHTTGTVGDSDRLIVAVLTQYPPGTSFLDAAATLTLLTRSLKLTDAARLSDDR